MGPSSHRWVRVCGDELAKGRVDQFPLYFQLKFSNNDINPLFDTSVQVSVKFLSQMVFQQDLGPSLSNNPVLFCVM